MNDLVSFAPQTAQKSSLTQLPPALIAVLCAVHQAVVDFQDWYFFEQIKNYAQEKQPKPDQKTVVVTLACELSKALLGDILSSSSPEVARQHRGSTTGFSEDPLQVLHHTVKTLTDIAYEENTSGDENTSENFPTKDLFLLRISIVIQAVNCLFVSLHTTPTDPLLRFDPTPQGLFSLAQSYAEQWEMIR